MIKADVTLLKTWDDCDVATASLTKEKKTYAHRDVNQTYAETQATDRATTTATQLTKAIDDVAHYTAEVARLGITDAERRAAQRSLISATARRDNLQLNTETTTGPAAFLTEADADQVDGQIDILQALIDLVAAHRLTLTA
jgi:hypothetical protein